MSSSYAELDATLSRVATEKADAVAEVVAVVRGRSAGVDRTPAEAIRVLNAWYLKARAADATARAAGAVPAASGVVGALRPDAMASLDRTMVYLLALASLHGLDLDDTERRKTLLMAVLLGDEGAKLASSAVQGAGGSWARRLATLPRAGAVGRVAGGNPLLGQLVGAALDRGLAVAMAAGGETIQAQAVVTQAARAFGDPPAFFPGQAGQASGTPRGATPRGPQTSPLPPSAVYARALARTVHKAKKRLQED